MFPLTINKDPEQTSEFLRRVSFRGGGIPCGMFQLQSIPQEQRDVDFLVRKSTCTFVNLEKTTFQGPIWPRSMRLLAKFSVEGQIGFRFPAGNLSLVQAWCTEESLSQKVLEGSGRGNPSDSMPLSLTKATGNPQPG